MRGGGRAGARSGRVGRREQTRRKVRLENPAGPARGHFPGPGAGIPAPADRPADKPAQAPGPVLEGGAAFLFFPRAFSNLPARLAVAFVLCRHGKQEHQLAFHVNGNTPPSLLEALDGLEGNTEQSGKFPLGFGKMDSYSGKLFRGQGIISSGFSNYHIVVLNQLIFHGGNHGPENYPNSSLPG